MTTLNAQTFLERYPEVSLPDNTLAVLFEELSQIESREPGFLERDLKAIRAGKLVGTAFVDSNGYGCAYGHGTSLNGGRAVTLAQEMRRTLKVWERVGITITPIEFLVAEVRAGDTPQNNQSLALLEEVLLFFLAGQEVVAPPQSC